MKSNNKIPVFVTAIPRIMKNKKLSFIRIVELFAENLLNGDYKIKQKAFDIPCQLEDQKASLGWFLLSSIRNYVVVKSDETDERILQYANECIIWITQARTMDVVIEGESLTTKLGKCETSNKQLKNQLKACRKRCQELEQLNKISRYFGDKNHFTGDVIGL